MKDKQQSYFVNIGSSSLLVIFLVLCLVTFAVLSLSSARSDHTFSERLAAHKQAYYEASSRAETILDEIDSALCETAQEIDLSGHSNPAVFGEGAGGPEALEGYFASVGEALDQVQIEGVTLQVVRSEEACDITFQVPAGEQQALSVILRVTDYREDTNYYAVKTWKTVGTGSRESEQPLQLMPVIQE